MSNYNRLLALMAASMLAYWCNPGMSQEPEKTIHFTDIIPPTNAPDTQSTNPVDTLDNGPDSITPSALRSPELLNMYVYPNPASDRVLVTLGSDGEKVALAIYSAEGRRVGSLFTNEWKDLSLLPAGVYFIRQEAQSRVRLKPLRLCIHR